MSSGLIRPLDREALRREFAEAEPFPHIALDDFLELDFAKEVAAAYPSYADARGSGREFRAVNENRKVQITDPASFPEPVKQLNEALASRTFVEDLEYITGIENLLYDELLQGGGMHLTGPSGRLDVHVDFNFIESRRLHRRLNILIYLNEEWKDDWGGAVELWDQDVRTCARSVKPLLNRCVVFETSEISYHGVEPVTCPRGIQRNSFASYYFTKEAPAHWDGTKHTTIFKARPNEKLRAHVLVPLQKARKNLSISGKRAIKKLIGRE